MQPENSQFLNYHCNNNNNLMFRNSNSHNKINELNMFSKFNLLTVIKLIFAQNSRHLFNININFI